MTLPILPRPSVPPSCAGRVARRRVRCAFVGGGVLFATLQILENIFHLLSSFFNGLFSEKEKKEYGGDERIVEKSLSHHNHTPKHEAHIKTGVSVCVREREGGSGWLKGEARGCTETSLYRTVHARVARHTPPPTSNTNKKKKKMPGYPLTVGDTYDVDFPYERTTASWR